jgi:hypothetical protein
MRKMSAVPVGPIIMPRPVPVGPIINPGGPIAQPVGPIILPPGGGLGGVYPGYPKIPLPPSTFQPFPIGPTPIAWTPPTGFKPQPGPISIPPMLPTRPPAQQNWPYNWPRTGTNWFQKLGLQG